MLSRRAALQAPAAVRAFTTTAATRTKRPPSLGDIQPGQHETFNSRQKTFREQLGEAQKQREASAFTSSSSSSSSSSSPPPYASISGAQGLGSLSTASSGIGNAALAAEKEPARPAGRLTNLIYGTKEGRELDAQIEASFSQLLARGKYVHSIEFHEVKPDCVDQYVELVGRWYPRVASMPENKVHLVGSWRTEVGDCDTFGEFPPLTSSRECCRGGSIELTSRPCSPHLGIPALRGLPRVAVRHLARPRVPGVRPAAAVADTPPAGLAHAGVQLLADDAAAATGRRVRAAVVHAAPGQPA